LHAEGCGAVMRASICPETRQTCTRDCKTVLCEAVRDACRADAGLRAQRELVRRILFMPLLVVARAEPTDGTLIGQIEP